MTRPLARILASDIVAVRDALAAALDGSGPAVLPVLASLGEAAMVPGGGLSALASAGGAAEVSEAVPNLVPNLVSTQVPTQVPDEVVLVIETSGSTGRPKRVALSAQGLRSHASASAEALGSQAPAGSGRAQWLLCLPTHYVAGAQVLVRSVLQGSEPVIMPAGHFDAAVFVATAKRLTGAEQYTSMVPTQLTRLVESAEQTIEVRDCVRRFDAILVGGQALSPSLVERAAELDFNVVRTYGASETGGGCVYNGLPIPGVLAREVSGELELGGQVLAWGYLGDSERTAATFVTQNTQRWYRTGDLGQVGPDGRVTVRGRADNVIISGGEKISLDVLERFVRGLAGFEEAVVIPTDDPEWGQRPVVVVAEARQGATSFNLADEIRVPSRDPVSEQAEQAGSAEQAEPASFGQLRPAEPPSFDELRRSVRQTLGRPCVPEHIIRVPQIPLLASGKPDRQRLIADTSEARGKYRR